MSTYHDLEVNHVIDKAALSAYEGAHNAGNKLDMPYYLLGDMILVIPRLAAITSGLFLFNGIVCIVACMRGRNSMERNNKPDREK